MNMKKVLGTVTVVAIAAGTIYAIKKSRDAKKAEEQAISVEEAEAMVKEREGESKNITEEVLKGYVGKSKHDLQDENVYDEDEEEEYTEQVKTIDQIDVNAIVFSAPITDIREVDESSPLTDEELDEIREDAHDIASFNRSFIPYEDEEDGIDENIEGPIITEDEETSDYELGEFTEEDRVLRHEPSSLEALKQYKRMELAELEYSHEVYDTMIRLFDFPFQPINDGDEVLRTQIIDYRVRFFGFDSQWVQQISFAEVILHYARVAVFNCNQNLGYWVEYFLSFNDLWSWLPNSAKDETIKLLNEHQYFNQERQTFGLFGLTREGMDQAITIANRNFDSSVTYEIEFQEFLKSTL
jgi:hypothetical protein